MITYAPTAFTAIIHYDIYSVCALCSSERVMLPNARKVRAKALRNDRNPPRQPSPRILLFRAYWFVNRGGAAGLPVTTIRAMSSPRQARMQMIKPLRVFYSQRCTLVNGDSVSHCTDEVSSGFCTFKAPVATITIVDRALVTKHEEQPIVLA